MKEVLFETLAYFIIYSFLGWVIESIVRSIAERKIINTGFLHGPFCPIYGVGAIILYQFLSRFSNNLILLFFISVIVLTLWEYIVGVMLEKMFNTKYWGYSDHKFNFQGRICLVNSICWGVLGIVFIKYIHPFIESQIQKIDVNLLYYIVGILTFIALVDMIASIIKVKNINVTLNKIEELNKEIREKLAEIKSLRKEAEKNAEKMAITENIQKIVLDLKKKRNKTILHLYRNVYRLKKAFPAINTKEITEVLNQKIDTIKNKQKHLKKK